VRIARDHGVQYVLTKPADPKKILSTVAMALGEEKKEIESQSFRLTTAVELELLQAQYDDVNRQFASINSCLGTLLDFTHQSLSERDPAHLTQNFCHVARSIVEAQYSAVGLLDDTGENLLRFHTSCEGGGSAGQEFAAPAARQGLLSTVVAERHCVRWSILQECQEKIDLPELHPEIRTLIAVPISTAARVYGWVYAINRQSQSAFSDVDERLLLSLGQEMALFLENTNLSRLLNDRIAELNSSNEELQQFAYVCSHDLQEPLRTISNYTQLLAKRYRGEMDVNADQFIDFIVDGAKRMQQQIDDLLSYSRVNQPVQFELTDCSRPLSAALKTMKLVISETEAQIEVAVLPSVHCDGRQLQQLFQNLVSNAIKFRSTQPPVVHIGCQESENFWTFSVSDNGIGFDIKNLDRIFVIFKRLHTREIYPGSGIGLSICKKIVERHGEHSRQREPQWL